MKRSVLSNISLNVVMKGISYFFSFITVMYVTRVLQPTAYGRVSFAGNMAGYFMLISSLGMPVYAMRCCAEARSDRKELSTVWNELWSVNFLFSGISLLALIPAIFLSPKLHENSLLIIIYCSGVVFRLLGCEWLYKGLEKYRFLTVTMFVSKVVSLVMILAFVHSPENYILYAFLSVLAGHGSDMVSFFSLRKNVDLNFRLRINKAHFRPLIIFSLMSGAVYIYNSLDMTMLGFMKSDYELGLYSLAVKVKTVLSIFGSLVWTAVLPTATSLWKEGDR